MKILVTSYYMPPTDRIGAGVQMHMIANAYADLGHDVTVVSPSTIVEPGARYKLVSRPLRGTFRIIRWAIVLSQMRPLVDFIHFAGEDYIYKRVRDEVHLRTFLGSCFAEASVATRLSDKIRMVLIGSAESFSVRRADIATVISKDTSKYVGNRAKIVPCGVDLTQFLPAECKSSVPSILFVGTLDSRKRGKDLLNAYTNHIQPKLPNAELWLVRESGIVDIPGVKVFGSVSQEKLIELYQQAWVFCLPSSYEGFGVPYIEAMACGTPVVATPNPGALEVLDYGKYGVVTLLENLGESLVSLLSNADERTKYIELGLTRVKEYDILKVAQRYIDLVIEFRERKSSN